VEEKWGGYLRGGYEKSWSCNRDTALTVAAQNGNKELVQLLLEHGADTTHKMCNTPDVYYTPMQVATNPCRHIMRSFKAQKLASHKREVAFRIACERDARAVQSRRKAIIILGCNGVAAAATAVAAPKLSSSSSSSSLSSSSSNATPATAPTPSPTATQLACVRHAATCYKDGVGGDVDAVFSARLLLFYLRAVDRPFSPKRIEDPDMPGGFYFPPRDDTAAVHDGALTVGSASAHVTPFCRVC
jgi:hypothetical protein